MEKKINAVSLLLCFSGFGAGAFSISEVAQMLGAITAFISGLAIAYQVITITNANNALIRAQAEKEQALADKEKAEAKKIDAQAEKQQIENDKLNKNSRK